MYAPGSVIEAHEDTRASCAASNRARRGRSALGRARRALAPRPALRATVARRPEAAEHDRPYRAALRGSRPHTDHLGSTTTISESDGRVTGQSFDPFGAPIDPLNPAITRVGFTGQDQDVDLGLTDMKGRIYDPLGGRFTGVDPVMQAPFSSQGLNRYSYVFNDPINNTDPSGFDSTAWDVVGGIFTTGVVGLLCYGTGDCSGATLGSAASAASGGASIGLPFLSGFAGAARPGMSYSVAPTATPKSSSGSPGTTQVLGQNGPSNFLNARRPPRSCDVGLCLAQAIPAGEGAPSTVELNDGTGGGAPAYETTVIDQILSFVGGEVSAAINIVVTVEQHRQAYVAQMAAKKASSANQMNDQVKRGQAPSQVKRVDAAHPPEDPRIMLI